MEQKCESCGKNVDQIIHLEGKTLCDQCVAEQNRVTKSKELTKSILKRNIQVVAGVSRNKIPILQLKRVEIKKEIEDLKNDHEYLFRVNVTRAQIWGENFRCQMCNSYFELHMELRHHVIANHGSLKIYNTYVQQEKTVKELPSEKCDQKEIFKKQIENYHQKTPKKFRKNRGGRNFKKVKNTWRWGRKYRK